MRRMQAFVAFLRLQQTQVEPLTHARPHVFQRSKPLAWKGYMAGWGGRIRTSVWRNQNPLPYHLATPHQDTGSCAGRQIGCRERAVRASRANRYAAPAARIANHQARGLRPSQVFRCRTTRARELRTMPVAAAVRHLPCSRRRRQSTRRPRPPGTIS